MIIIVQGHVIVLLFVAFDIFAIKIKSKADVLRIDKYISVMYSSNIFAFFVVSELTCRIFSK